MDQGWKDRGGGAANLHVTNKLASKLLSRVELVRKPLRKILANRVAF
jgi:hypothetical protein